VTEQRLVGFEIRLMVFGGRGEKCPPLAVFELQGAQKYGVRIPDQITFIGIAGRREAPFEKLLKIPTRPGGEEGQRVVTQIGDCHSRNHLVLIHQNQAGATSVPEFGEIRPACDYMGPSARQVLQ